ncbi:hypothetical protein F4780DRAFT_770257 [Xylariomycetidae sp. FL0641]|nr:hypothetical protein F4780DRAFT_770257 [Xylariomycetidae sp. FL0641]
MALATRPDSGLLGYNNPNPRIPSTQVAALHARPESAQLFNWYIGDRQQAWSDPAKDAYDQAVAAFQKELSVDEYAATWLRTKNSMQDVRDALSNALLEYSTKSKESRLRKWLASCSSRVMYYGAIFDTFAQHHPEYVSLAWGAMKFLFIAVLNHEELLTEISKAVAKIADALPRTEMLSGLYPTPRMREAVSLVYAKIIDFAILAIKWYKKGKLKHSISAIAKPFGLSFKPILEEITERSRRVDELASAASKAEIRDLHLRVGSDLDLLGIVQQQQQTLHNQSLFALQTEYKQLFRKGQIDEIQNTLLLEDAPMSEEGLAYCKSMRNRRRQKLPTQLPVPALSKLKSWVAEDSSSLLLAQGRGVRASSLDFAADFLEAVMEQGYPVIWALPSTIEEGMRAPSITGVLRSLSSQILNLDPSIMSEGTHPITVKHFKSATTIHQWFGLLERCISAFSRLFVVIDMGLIETACEHEEAEEENFKVDDFIEYVSEMVKRRTTGGLKIVIASWRFETTTSLEADEVFGDLQVFTDMGKKTERLMRQPKYRAVFRKRNQVFTERLKSSVRITSP